MDLGLRWRLLLITVVPLVALAVGMVWLVNRGISRQVHANVREDLSRAAAVFENVLAARAEELDVAGRIVVEDPKFFSVLTLSAHAQDPQFRATVAGVAQDFNAIIQADVFEVLGPDGSLLATVGPLASEPEARRASVAAAIAGATVSAILHGSEEHFQATVAPVRAGGRVIGALLLGERLGQALAERLRALTRSEVTFLSGGIVTASTLERHADRLGVERALVERGASAPFLRAEPQVFEWRGRDHAYLTLSRAVPRSAADSRQLYVLQRALDVETAFLREVQSHLAELGIAAVLLVLAAGALISHGITSPVRRLVSAAEEMERGNYDFPLEVRRRDEIGLLASRFQEMRRRQRLYVSSLEEVARMKSEFISVASHELRTPISVIHGFQELMRRGTLGPITDEQRDALDGIGSGVSQLTRIAEDATRVAELEGARSSLALAEHDVRDLVEQAVSASRARASGRRLELGVDVAPDLGTLRVDGPRVVEALEHLVANAIRFTPDGGHVRVLASRQDDWCVMEVRDDGIGIPPERLATLFERSLVVRNSLNHHSSGSLEFNSAGLGLGLPLARGIAEAHEGTLVVTSEPGRGSTFALRLPLGRGAERGKAA